MSTKTNSAKISLQQLESFLLAAAGTLRGSMDPSEYKEFIFGMLFIKRMSDEFDKKKDELAKKFSHLKEDAFAEIIEDKNSYGDTFFIPKQSRWHEGYVDDNKQQHPPLKDSKENIGERLNKAIDGIEDENTDVLNGVLKGNIDFNKTVGKNKRISDGTWKELIDVFNDDDFLLTNDNFEFPDLLGAAYEYLIKFFADSAGKKGGEFYTPNEVVRLLVQIIKPKENMEIYDPTVGSGGMLIQSSQYLEDQGGNPRKLVLYGQEKSGTVWSICMMNMILHNRPDAHIENGDTIEKPEHVENGQIKKFDRVIANPPFSQNYNKSEVTAVQRFPYGWAPEKGKKGDFMFVQHMIASLKPKGMMATIMPHGILFRSGIEKLIREGIVEEKIIEAIIGLPPSLFYGTSIPACILIINKNKPDELKEKIFIINADKEFGEGKSKNFLRPEDVEKIDYVFTNKIEIPNYSKLVDLSQIIDDDYNLNIRRYLDTTPAPNDEDVSSHLTGGIPISELEKNKDILQKFNFNLKTIFKTKTKTQYEFITEITDKEDLRNIIDSDSNVSKIYDSMDAKIKKWWKSASEDFSKIASSSKNKMKISEIRADLLDSLKKELLSIGILDEYQCSGVFVNWWKNSRYDLKTISSVGWSSKLLSDELLGPYFFKNENDDVKKISNEISQNEDILKKKIDEVEYEAEKDEKITPTLIKNYLSEQIKSLQEKPSDSAIKECVKLESLLENVKKPESEIKKLKTSLKSKNSEIEQKLKLKRDGTKESENYYLELIKQAKKEIQIHEKNTFDDKKDERKRKTKITKLNNDVTKLEGKIDGLNELFSSMGGKINDEETKELILTKHYQMINSELTRYINYEKRHLLSVFEQIWERYSSSLDVLESNRNSNKKELDKFLTGLHYFD